jgi:hypothetical protein
MTSTLPNTDIEVNDAVKSRAAVHAGMPARGTSTETTNSGQQQSLAASAVRSRKTCSETSSG